MALSFVLKLLATLPLSWLHLLGSWASWCAALASASYPGKIKQNLKQSKICDDKELTRLINLNISETGKGFFELPFIWFRPKKDVLSCVRTIHGEKYLKQVISGKTGGIFITPHLGGFEIIPVFISEFTRITSLYRPPHKRFLTAPMLEGRCGVNQSVASADLRGVRLLFKALKKGEIVGILPDQVPKKGDGKWVDFFGRPAYTMTLVQQLAARTKAPIVFTYAVRIKNGAGFDLFFEPIDEYQGEFNTEKMNKKIEAIVRKYPSQYLWAYNRYKRS